MTKEKSESKNSSEKQKDEKDPKGTTPNPTKSEDGYASKDSPNNFSDQYDALVKTEQRLAGINEEIQKIKDLLKPISRIERKRGATAPLSAAQRKLNKAKLRKLEEERFIENQNWQNQYRAFGERTIFEIEKSRNSLLAAQGRSGYYAKRYSGTIVNRFKTLFDTVLKNNPRVLSQFRTSLNNSSARNVNNITLDFIKANEENPFLSTFYGTHKDLQSKYNQLISALLHEWRGKSPREYLFKQSNLDIEE